MEKSKQKQAAVQPPDQMPNFFFKDSQVLEMHGKRKKASRKNCHDGTSGATPYPASIKDCKSYELKIAWSFWYPLALTIRTKIGNCNNNNKPLATFGFRNNKYTLKFHPCVALRLGLPGTCIFPFPAYDAMTIYNEIIRMMR
ncbi:MAG: hypothetical protein PHT44_03860 [Candidatus Portnoybacteria bacterium]|nr:hypothetical protein [Candidatus Portnoybacteria bacterium]MDD4983039.1 hypothetical protein [Candidatus Portnoybacteria bacterium]